MNRMLQELSNVCIFRGARKKKLMTNLFDAFKHNTLPKLHNLLIVINTWYSAGEIRQIRCLLQIFKSQNGKLSTFYYWQSCTVTRCYMQNNNNNYNSNIIERVGATSPSTPTKFERFSRIRHLWNVQIIPATLNNEPHHTMIGVRCEGERNHQSSSFLY